MSRPTKPTRQTTTSSAPFASKKGNERGGAVTSERIAADLTAFRKAGGRIEVLGNTRSLTKIDPDGTNPPPESTAEKPAAKRSR